MSTIHFKLDDTLRRHKKTPAALVEASGLAKATVYNIVNNKAKAVELETLSKLMSGLRKLTKEDITLTDIIEEESKPDWREEILKNAKPFNWAEIEKTLPPLTPEEEAEADEFIRFLEERRKESIALSAKRQEKLFELFEDDSEESLEETSKA